MTAEGASPSPVANQLLELVARGERNEAVRVVRSLLVSAADPAALIEGVLVPLQRRVGELWELSLLDVVEEHEMTAVVEELLSAIMFHAPRGTERGRVIFACPHGEWHTLPARMASELLQMHDWSVTFSGASTPGATLAAFVRSHRPLAVVLSCTMASGLATARDAIEVLHEEHVPVLVGGPGFGLDDRRAHAVGADGWAHSVSDADRILGSWSRHAPTLNMASGAPHAVLSPSDTADAVEAALRRLDRRVRAGNEDGTGVTARDLSSMLDVVNVGLLTDDPRVVSDLVEWYRHRFRVRRLPAETIDLVLEALGPRLPPSARSFLSPRTGDVDIGAS